jgi:hypothetical protein
MTIKILDIGSGPQSVASAIFSGIEDKEIVRLDASLDVNPEILHDITQPLPEELRSNFDLVLASHVMEHVERSRVVEAFRNAMSAVKNLGEVWIITPSLEWTANEVINKRDGVHVQALLYGTQDSSWDLHRCGFTLASLRQMVELCGLIVRKAYQSPFTVMMNGREYQCIQNIVIGARYDGLNGDPAEAIGEMVA